MSKTLTQPIKWPLEIVETLPTHERLIMSGPRGVASTVAALTKTQPWSEGHVMATADSTVTYRDIPEHPGYRAGDDGSVWSCWRFKGGGYGRPGKYVMLDRWHQLKPYPRKEDGRKRYTLKRADGTYRRAYGATLVLEAFVGPCPEGMEACHNDGNCLNDYADNLRWDTPEANAQDKQRHGTQPRGERINTAKLTADDVREIRRIGKPLRQHAEKYGVTEALVSAILKRKVWQHVE